MTISRPARLAMVGLFFLAATTVYTYPLVFEPSTRLLVGGGDYLAESATVVWHARQLVRNPLRLWNSPFYYPSSHAVVQQQPAAFTGLLAAPLLGLGAGPLLACNALVILSMVTSGVLTYTLARDLTGRELPGILAGLVFAFFPNRMDHLGQFTYQMGALMPLATWAACRFLLRGRWTDLALLVATLWAQALSSLYNAFGLVLLLVAFAVALRLVRPDPPPPRTLLRALVGAVGLVLALTPFLAPYWQAHRELGLQRDLDLSTWFGMDLLSLLDPGVFNRLYAGRLVGLGRSEGGLFPGFVVLILAAAAGWSLRRPAAPPDGPRWVRISLRALGFVALACAAVAVAAPLVAALGLRPSLPSWLRVRNLTLPVNALPLLALAWIALDARREPAPRPSRRQWTMVFLFLSVSTFLTTLSPNLPIGERRWGTGLFEWIYEFVPGASAFRAPGRWSLAFALPLALLAALGLRVIQDAMRPARATALSLVLVAGVLIEYNVAPLPWDRLGAPPPVYDWLARQPGDSAVVELPIREVDNGWAMFWGLRHGKRVVNGHGGFDRPLMEEIARASDPFRLPALLTALRAIFPLRYVVVHVSELGGAARDWGEPLRSPPPGFRLVRRFDGDDVYLLDGTPETGVDLHRRFPTDLLRSRPLAYRLRLAGEDPDVVRWIDVRFNDQAIAHFTADGGGRLEPPLAFRTTEPNDLWFRHEYRIGPEATRAARYLIGRTGVQAPVDLHVTSGGIHSGDTVSVRVNGHETLEDPRRGYSVVTLDPSDGRVLAVTRFDPFRSETESRRLAQFIDTVAPGAIVVVALRDNGAGQLGADGVRALRAVGGIENLRGTSGLSHLIVGVKGARAGEALELHGDRLLTATVGAERPLGVTLEALGLD
jgi:Interleukin-like EMT inducer